MRLNNHYSKYGINGDYAKRREFHQSFWDALRAQLRHWTSSTAPARKPDAASV